MFLKLIFAWLPGFIIFWVISMFAKKRTLKRQSVGSRLIYTIPFFLAFWLLFVARIGHRHLSLESAVLPHALALNIMSLVLTVLGLSLALWARIVLGKNWSGTVTFKEHHELIVRGPYAYVRHPIYTAMLLMFLGTA